MFPSVQEYEPIMRLSCHIMWRPSLCCLVLQPNLFSPENSPATGKLLWLNGRDLVLASKSRLGANTQFDDGSQQVTDVGGEKKFEEPVIVEQIGEQGVERLDIL